MLTALHTNGVKFSSTEIEDQEFVSESTWKCTICDEELIYVREGSDGTIPHFRHKTKSGHRNISEGPVHNKAKKEFAEKLRELKEVKQVELEKIIMPKVSRKASKQLFNREFEIADIYFNYKGEDAVLEVQCSNQSWEDFKLRTLYYNLHGYNVLWILNKDTFIRTDSSNRYISKKSYYNLEDVYKGRVYMFNADSNTVKAVKLDNFVSKTRARTLKTNELEDFDIFLDNKGVVEIARFTDKYNRLSKSSSFSYEEFECPYCGKNYDSESYYRKHVRNCFE